VRNTVAVEGNGGRQDDKEHDQIREKRADTDIHSPQLKFFDRCASPFRERTLTCALFLFNFFARLPEKQIWTDRGAENRDQRRPFISGVRHRRYEGIANHSPPIRPHHKGGDGVCEEHQHQPFEHVR
jgi:hypothetical protein